MKSGNIVVVHISINGRNVSRIVAPLEIRQNLPRRLFSALPRRDGMHLFGAAEAVRLPTA
ncbi:hypothetical protein E2553_27725 [Paraburkholderia dipogonis]|uniref:Uncharacterized protein n=1 Tax=Paraburkholderia dipogonis TaxID=1211383 RepID=A0A4Y8MSY8_9BURK|nr:hypothetical protein [Paraburkholderia dipogonis]TFE40522.1 hypothetical protein E2553_27725 [Paraburkholderia dipogonis]